MTNQPPRLHGIASLVAQQGRNGDSVFVHMSPEEVQAMASIGKLTINPETGMPEAFSLGGFFKGLAKIAAPIAGSLLGGPMGGALFAGLAGGLTSGVLDKSFKSGLVNGAMSGLTAGAFGAGKDAVSAAKGVTESAARSTATQQAASHTAQMGSELAREGGESTVRAAADAAAREAATPMSMIDKFRVGGKGALDYLSDDKKISFLYPQIANMHAARQQEILERERGGRPSFYDAARQFYDNQYNQMFGNRTIGGFAAGGEILKDGNQDNGDDVNKPGGGGSGGGGGVVTNTGGGGNRGANIASAQHMIPTNHQAGFMPEAQYFANPLYMASANAHLRGVTTPQYGHSPFDTQYTDQVLAGAGPTSGDSDIVNTNGQMSTQNSAYDEYMAKAMGNISTEAQARLAAQEKFPYNAPGGESEFNPTTMTPGAPDFQPFDPSKPDWYKPAGWDNRTGTPFIPGDFDPTTNPIGFTGGWTTTEYTPWWAGIGDKPTNPPVNPPVNPPTPPIGPPPTQPPVQPPQPPTKKKPEEPKGPIKPVRDPEELEDPWRQAGNPEDPWHIPSPITHYGGDMYDGTYGEGPAWSNAWNFDQRNLAKALANNDYDSAKKYWNHMNEDGRNEWLVNTAANMNNPNYTPSSFLSGFADSEFMGDFAGMADQSTLDDRFGKLLESVYGTSDYGKIVEDNDLIKKVDEYRHRPVETPFENQSKSIGSTSQIYSMARDVMDRMAGGQELNTSSNVRDGVVNWKEYVDAMRGLALSADEQLGYTNGLTLGQDGKLHAQDRDAANSGGRRGKSKTFTDLGEALSWLGIDGYAGGGLLSGPGGGMDDGIAALVGDTGEPVRVASGEFVMPADVVSMLGDGDTSHGAKLLEEMIGRIRQKKTGSPKQAKPIDPNSVMPV